MQETDTFCKLLLCEDAGPERPISEIAVNSKGFSSAGEFVLAQGCVDTQVPSSVTTDLFATLSCVPNSIQLQLLPPFVYTLAATHDHKGPDRLFRVPGGKQEVDIWRNGKCGKLTDVRTAAWKSPAHSASPSQVDLVKVGRQIYGR